MSEKKFIDLTNKVIVVTGASAGIGEAIALEFARQGCHLALCGRDERRLQQVRDKCQREANSKIQIELVSGDITERDIQRRIVEATVRVFGRIDILINNAGIGLLRTPENTTNEEFQNVMRTNVESLFFLTQAAIPYLIKTKGNIINISSIVSEMAAPAYTVYAMTKAAIDSYTKSLALYLARHQVRVNAVNPASIESLIYRRGPDAMSDEQYEQFKKKQSSSDLHPLGRMGLPSEVADVVVYLVSDRASFVTGQMVFVDGGRNIVGVQPRL